MRRRKNSTVNDSTQMPPEEVIIIFSITQLSETPYQFKWQLLKFLHQR